MAAKEKKIKNVDADSEKERFGCSFGNVRVRTPHLGRNKSTVVLSKPVTE